MYRARSFALFYCEILQRKIKNSFHSCKNKNKFWKASNGFVYTNPKIYFVILVGKLRVCRTNPKTSFCLACLEGNFPSTFSVASLDLKQKRHPKIFLGHLFLCVYVSSPVIKLIIGTGFGSSYSLNRITKR